MIEMVLNITHDMRLCKSKFWKAMDVNPICDPDHVTEKAALQLTKESRLKAWWQKPGFPDWFKNESEFEVKMDSAKYTAIDTLLDIMANPDSPASARVAAAKLVIDHASKSSKNTEELEKMLEKISGTSKIEDLKKFVQV